MRMPDHGLDMQTKGAVIAIGTIKGKGRHSQHDEPRVDLVEFLPIDLGLVHGFRDIVLYQYVAVLNQPQERLSSLGRHDIAGHRPFIARMRVKRGIAVPRVQARIVVGQAGGHALGGESSPLFASRHAFHASGIGLRFVGWLYSNDICTPLRQELGHMGPSPDHSNFCHSHALQGQAKWRIQSRLNWFTRCHPGRELNLVSMLIE